MKEDAPEWDPVLILGARDGPCEEGRHTPAKDLVGKKKIKNSEVALFQSRADEMGKADGSDLKKNKKNPSQRRTRLRCDVCIYVHVRAAA